MGILASSNIHTNQPSGSLNPPLPHRLTQMIQFTYPTGHMNGALPLLSSHLAISDGSAPHVLSSASTSSGVLVRRHDIHPSNTSTVGKIGTTYVKNKAIGAPHNRA